MTEITVNTKQRRPSGGDIAPQESSPRILRNRIGDDSWRVQVQASMDPHAESFTLDFSGMEDLTKRQTLQRVLLHTITGGMGWADSTQRLVAGSKSYAAALLRAATEIYQVWVAYYDNLSLQSLSRSDITNLLRSALEDYDRGDGPPSANRLRRFARVVNASAELRAKGLIADGALHRVTASLKRDIAGPLLKPHSVRYEQWMAGGSWGGIPIDIALVWLMEATEIIHARNTKILLAYFAVWRASPPATVQPQAVLQPLVRYRKYQKTGSWSSSHRKWLRDAILEFGKAFDEHVNDAGIGPVDELPWQSLKELGDYCSLVRNAGITILHLVAGNRVHEVSGYRTDQWKRDAKGVWWYRSAESKVNKGGNADRSIDPIGAEVVDILKHMSYLDPDVPRPVAGWTFSIGAMAYSRQFRGLPYGERVLGGWSERKVKRPLHTATVRSYFNKFYRSHLVEKHPELGKKHPHAHPHQARHFFADIALRWLDPRYTDIIANLREHYRHAGDWMIHTYTDSKRSEDIQAEAERRYLIEILQRISDQKPDDTWFGAAAKRIRNESHDIRILSLEELADIYEEQADLYSKFVVWEWGICAVRAGEESKASCADTDTGMPNLLATDREKSPDVCNGCVHQLVHTGFKSNIHRIALACHSRGKVLDELSRPYLAKKVGHEPAKRAEKIFREMSL